MALRTGSSAITWAKSQHYRRSYNWTGMCLKFTRMCYNVSAKYYSAEVAWYASQKRHTSWPPPPGVPVWWTNGRYGHVAISDGNGYCWSTDILRTGYVDRVSINYITSKWGQRYRGWTEDINGVTVYTPPPPKTTPVLDVSVIAEAARNRKRAPHGRLLKRAVAREVGRGPMALRFPRLGRGFRRQYKKVQVKYLELHGMTVNDRSADGIPGYGSLRWLGRRHGFNVKR